MAEHALIEQLDQAIDQMLAGSEQTRSADVTLSALLEIAGALRDLPDDGFKTRLGRELQAASQRRTRMTSSTRIEPLESAAADPSRSTLSLPSSPFLREAN